MSELQNFQKPKASSIEYRKEHFRGHAKIRLEQNNDVLCILRAKIEGEVVDGTELTQDSQYKHY